MKSFVMEFPILGIFHIVIFYEVYSTTTDVTTILGNISIGGSVIFACNYVIWIRPLEEGDIVNVDISVYLNGVHGDLNETFYVGEVDDDSMRLTEGTYASLMEAIKQCKPGMYYREIGNIINDVADKFGYFFDLILSRLSVIRSYCGHGIGTEFHCCPNIPHYRKNKAVFYPI